MRGGREPAPRGRAQPRALRLPQVGEPLLPERRDRPAGRRHLPPAQHRALLRRGHHRRPRRGRGGRGLLRHPRRHGLAHHDRQRRGRAGLGRRRHRGGGRGARPAHLDARAARGGASPSPGRPRRASRAWTSPLTVAQLLRAEGVVGFDRRGDGRGRGVAFRHPARVRVQHDAGVRRHRHALPGRRRHLRLPRARRARRGRDGLRARLPRGPGRLRRGRGALLRPHARARPRLRRALARRPVPAARPRGRLRPQGTLRVRRARGRARPLRARRGRGRRRARPRCHRHRRDHELHHGDRPGDDGRGGPARPPRRGARPCAASLGQEGPRPRQPRHRASPRALRARGAAPRARLLHLRLRLHELHRQLGGDQGVPEAPRSRARAHERALGQPQLRGAHLPGREPELTLCQPALVVAYSLAGTMDVDLASEPVGLGADGAPVMLSDIMPTDDEIAAELAAHCDASLFEEGSRGLLEGAETWRSIPSAQSATFPWDPASPTSGARPTSRSPGSRRSSRCAAPAPWRCSGTS